MKQIVTAENYRDIRYDVFKKFHEQLALLSCGTIDDFRCMTIGWGMMGNVWAHPGSALTVYVNPSRYTFDFMQQKDTFTVSFFPSEYRKDLMTLGTHSGRDGDKIALTSLTPKALKDGVGFEQAELTFVCKKIYAHSFDIDSVPANVRDGIYQKFPPHYMYIGYIEDAFGEIETDTP